MTEEADSLLASVTAEVRQIYKTERMRAQRLDRFEPGEKYDKFFERAARMCIENGVSPREFVLVQFFALRPYPEISVLGSATAMERFYKHRVGFAKDVASDVLLALNAYERLVGVGWDPREALLDKEQGFDPLFIYVAASTAGFEDICERYRGRALEQYVCGMYYDDLYKSAIPQELRDAAERIRRGV